MADFRELPFDVRDGGFHQAGFFQMPRANETGKDMDVRFEPRNELLLLRGGID